VLVLKLNPSSPTSSLHKDHLCVSGGGPLRFCEKTGVSGVTGDRVEVVDPEGVGEGGDLGGRGGFVPIGLSAK
jgi:hypothetical protein